VISLMTAGGAAIWAAALGTAALIRFFRGRRIGQYVREDGPQMHLAKAGTPTMGGLALVAAFVAGYLVAHVHTGVAFTPAGGLLLGVTIASAAIGFVDDLLKQRNRRSLGLNKRAKLAAQVVAAAGFAVGVHLVVGEPTTLSFTRFDLPGIGLGTVGWIAWSTFLVVASANAVNLTDGLDGLASGSATFCFACLAIIGYWQFRHFGIYELKPALDLALASVALAGACLGFLWWNAAPARIFMGDTGSLAVGSALGALAVLMELQLLLAVIGALYVIVTLSVVAQVVSFRLFGKRVLRMAPLHHHFELAGWPETTVIVRFWIMAGVFAALGLGTFYADFLSAANLR
jgi:phospho-N-acetylmuramoyl-pentapeptide-transferase